MKPRWWMAAGTLTWTLGCGSAGAKPIALGAPEAKLPAVLTQVGDVVELADGRIALVELRDRLFLFGDFADGGMRTVGERADIAPGEPAPGKYKFPGYVLHFNGDTLALVDFAAQRTTLWNERGEFLSVLGLYPVAGPNQPLAYDSLGHAYKEDYRSVMGGLEPGEKIRSDSLNVIRFPRDGTLGDTVVRLKLPELAEGKFGEEVKSVSTIFGGRDLFGVLPDGSIWVARADENRVDWRSPDGRWTPGAKRPYTKVPVTQADKDRFLEQAYASGLQRGVSVSFPFAKFKPPFVLGLTQPSGEAWLLRSRAAGDSAPVYDVVARDGTVRPPVQLPVGSTLAGFGKDGAIYLVLREADGKQAVGRYRLK